MDGTMDEVRRDLMAFAATLPRASDTRHYRRPTSRVDSSFDTMHSTASTTETEAVMLKPKFLSLTDASLADTYNRKEVSPEKLRAPLIKSLDKSKEQFESGTTRGRRSWSVKNDVVAFSPKLGGNPLIVGDTDTHYIPAERFGDFIEQFKASVTAGELDEVIKFMSGGETFAAAKRSRRGTISPEAAKLRGQKAAESRARNKAAAAKA